MKMKIGLFFGMVAMAMLLSIPAMIHPRLVLAAPPVGPTSIASQTLKGPYPATVGAGALAMTFTTADTVNGNSFPFTGHEVLIIWNSDSTSHTVTLTSVADQRGRSGDVTAYSVAGTSYAAFNFRAGAEGWMQSDSTMHLTSNSALVEFAILYIP